MEIWCLGIIIDKYPIFSECLVLLSNLLLIFQPWANTSLFLVPNYKKFLDFQIVFDFNQYWLVRCLFIRKEETSDKVSNYPPSCSYFVNWIAHGVELWVLFPIIEFPQDHLGVNL